MNTLERAYKSHLKDKWCYEGPVDVDVLHPENIRLAIESVKSPYDAKMPPMREDVRIVQVQYDICVGAIEDLQAILDSCKHAVCESQSKEITRILGSWHDRLAHYGGRLESARAQGSVSPSPAQQVRYLADAIGLHRPYLARMGWRPDVQWDAISGNVYQSGIWISRKLQSLENRALRA